MSALVTLLANHLTGNLEMLKQHLADFSDADFMVRPVAGANHAAWQVGHLVFLENMLCGIYVPQSAIKLPDGLDKLYGKEGASNDDASKFFKKDEALKHLEHCRHALAAWLKGRTEADLAAPSPEMLRGWVPTVGELFNAIPMHTAMHIGQIQVTRRKLGKKILF